MKKQTSPQKQSLLVGSRRWVVKVGTRVLVGGSGRPSRKRMAQIVEQICFLREQGVDVVLVSSGAIGSGMEALGLKKRPKRLPELQMAAAVGQSRLMAQYDKLFSAYGIRIGQVLLTYDDLKNRDRHLNARNTLTELLRNGIVPIVNENDVVAVEEIKFGDNDLLASLVTLLVEADRLILLSVTDGVRAPSGNGKTKRIPYLKDISAQTLALAKGKSSELAVGGMLSKLESARAVTRVGRSVVIADGRKKNVLVDIYDEKDVGTTIGGNTGVDIKTPPKSISGKKKWLAFFNRGTGNLTIDSGAEKALLQQGKSLLAVGIRSIEGRFPSGSVVRVSSQSGTEVARGVVNFSSDQLELIKGRRSAEVVKLLGLREERVVVHRNNLVLL